MAHFYVEPEVAGGLGDRTVMDRSVHPPSVKQLHYQLDGWLGDALLESFPAYIVTVNTKNAFLEMGVTGAAFDEVEVTVTGEFEALCPDRKLPPFAWLKPEGEAGRDDIGAAADGRLVVSQRALDVLNGLGIAHALVEPFERVSR